MNRKLIILIILSIFIFVFSVSIGSVYVPFEETVRILFNTQNHVNVNDQYINIIRLVRLPRVLTSFLVGSSLSLSGVVMQGLLKNPLADGSTLGVSSGAALGAVLMIFFGVNGSFFLFNGTFIGASIGAFCSLVSILFFSRIIDKNYSNITVILVGIIFSMLVSSMMSLLIALSGEKLRNIIFWTMGSLSGSQFESVIYLFVVLCLSTLFLLFKSKDLNAFALGEDNARNIGVNIVQTRVLLLVIVSILIGSSVAVAGSISFIGLIVPHMCRLLVGPNHFRLIPYSLFFGGNFLMMADLLARTIVSPVELPIGVITSLVGTVAFLIIMIREKSHGI